jgi:putative membrane protein
LSAAAYLLRRQVKRLRDLAQQGWLDSTRQTAMMGILGTVETSLGRCERLKNTPCPPQIAYFGSAFTWVFVFLLPLALLEVFEHETTEHHLSTILTHRYMYTMLPFSLLISWTFLITDKVSESLEDPFEGGVHNVPISALARSFEIELRQTLGDTDIPPPLEPVDDVLY